MRVVGNIASDSEVVATADGAITAGKPVLVNADGTVAQVAENAESQSVGTATSVGSDTTADNACVYDSNSDRVVIVYEDTGNSNYGTAIVGTVSGTSISFGTPVVFESANADFYNISFDSNANKVLIVYRDNGNAGYGTSIVGNVDSSDNSISFGTAVVYNSGAVAFCGIDFDTSNNKHLLVYRDSGDSSKCQSIVATVSGTSVSYGSETLVYDDNTNFQFCVFDSNANKFVAGFNDSSSLGRCKVGTISGTSVSYGSLATYHSGSGTVSGEGLFDSKHNQIIIPFSDSAASSYGRVVIGSISGTSISFGSEVTFQGTTQVYDLTAFYDNVAHKFVIIYPGTSGAASGKYIVGTTASNQSASFGTEAQFHASNISAQYQSFRVAFDSTERRGVFVIADTGDSDNGKAIGIRVAHTTQNLTSENFIGFAKDAVADGAVATLHTANSISRNQSSLTAGQTYFVQNDGTLSETADDPSVTAGTAISATELIVKG